MVSLESEQRLFKQFFNIRDLFGLYRDADNTDYWVFA